MIDSPSSETSRSSIVDALGGSEKLLRQGGRELLLNFYTVLRSLSLYPVENEQVQRALDELERACQVLLDVEDELEIRMQGEFMFVNSTRLRLGLDNFAVFSHILTTLRQVDVGAIRVSPEVDRREWQVFCSLLLTFAARDTNPNILAELQGKMVAGGITHIGVDPQQEQADQYQDEEHSKEVAKRTYERTVAVTKEVVSSVRMGKVASVKKVKRAVQSIVDQVLQNEVSITGLTTIRDYDDYTFVHSVNVTIFSVALGKRLGLSKLHLYDLGLAALFHDVGKSRVPLGVLNKTGGLNEEEWRIMQSHPWLGVLVLFGLRGYGEIPYRPMIAAYEHHMKIDLTGYPSSIRPRKMSMFSKIIAVADAFDAATSRRVYETTPLQPADVLKEMWENPRRGQDPALVKAFINLTGVYPVGTCVILDSYEVALIHAANPDPELINRPTVRIVMTQEGARMDPGELVDLSKPKAGGGFERSIIKVTDPEKYSINPSDYFV